MFSVQCAVSFHKGLRKPNNEDNFLLQWRLLKNADIEEGSICQTAGLLQKGFFGVFDGLGGLADGEQASFLAAKTMQKQVWLPPMRAGEGRLSELLSKLNKAVFSAAKEKQCKMGTTAAVMLLDKQNAVIGNVGDSRVYLYRQGTLRQLSEDHSDRELLEEMGIEDRKPSLMQYVGLSLNEVTPTISAHAHQNGDRFLLCSDGLTDMVSDAEIEGLCGKEKDPQVCTKALVNLALEHGGKDNITAMICDVKHILCWKKRVPLEKEAGKGEIDDEKDCDCSVADPQQGDQEGC